MESQIKAYYKSAKGTEVVTVFGYASKGIPGLEINAPGKISKNIKEKIIYLTRIRRLHIPRRRYVICVDSGELPEVGKGSDLRWLEFPILLIFWHLAGLIPISKLDDCISAGEVRVSGEIFALQDNADLIIKLKKFSPIERKSLKHITHSAGNLAESIWTIDSALLLEHIPNLYFR